jgi:hypothetical protein
MSAERDAAFVMQPSVVGQEKIINRNAVFFYKSLADGRVPGTTKTPCARQSAMRRWPHLARLHAIFLSPGLIDYSSDIN